MEHKEWNELRRKMAVEMFVSGATDMMIPADEARRTALACMEKSDGATAPGEQGSTAVQQWRSLERSAGDALIALEKLGMRVVAA
jgi:hypothetical protein